MKYKCLCCQDYMDYEENSLFVSHSYLRIDICICSKCNFLIKSNRKNDKVLNDFIYTVNMLNSNILATKETIEEIATIVAFDGISELRQVFKKEYSNLKSYDITISENAEKINNTLEDSLFILTLIGLKKTYYSNFRLTRSEAINMLGIKSQTITKYNKQNKINGRIKTRIYDRYDIANLLKMI